MGDSITEGWMDKRPGFFTRGRIDRGIGGQTTPQMVLRMIPDAVDLKPKAVHIMGGTNDIAGTPGR
jgi:lysophospholipase L1-like esterase